MTFLRPELLWWGALAALLAVVAWGARAWRRRKLAAFLGGRRAAARMSPRSDLYRLQLERLLLVVVAMLAAAAAAAEPEGWDTSAPEVAEREVVLVIDVSASMQASDATPTRLARAVEIANGLTERLAGQRVGLILFAGTPYVLAPPTRDLGAVRHFLSGVTGTIASAHDPGTLMSVAIHEAAGMWTDAPGLGEVRSIVVLTDGDAGEPAAAVIAEARAAGARGIHVHVVGVGTPQGSGMMMPPAPYQIDGPVLTETGSPAISRLDETLLEDIAEEGVGRYAHADDEGALDDVADALTPLPPPSTWWLRYDLPFVLIVIALLGLLVESLLGVSLPRWHAALRRREVA